MTVNILQNFLKLVVKSSVACVIRQIDIYTLDMFVTVFVQFIWCSAAQMHLHLNYDPSLLLVVNCEMQVKLCVPIVQVLTWWVVTLMHIAYFVVIRTYSTTSNWWIDVTCEITYPFNWATAWITYVKTVTAFQKTV